MKKILFTGARSGLINKVIDNIKNDYFIYLTVETDKQLENVLNKYKNDKNVKCLKLDITNSEDVENILKLDIDIFVSNAAVGYGGSILEIPFERVRKNYEVNVFCNFELIQKILQKMIKKSGKVIVISSLASIYPIKFLGSYCSTKASISSLTSCLNKEIKLINKNVKIKLIEPGFYRTGFNEVMFDNKYDIQNSFFKHLKKEIQTNETFVIKYVMKKNYNSIVKQIIKAINNDDDKFLYKAPFSHSLFTKVYQILKS